MGKERGREVGERGRNPGGTCHNDKPGLDSGIVERWEQGVGEMAGPATMASRACIGRVEESKGEEVGGEGTRKEKGGRDCRNYRQSLWQRKGVALLPAAPRVRAS